MSYGQPEGVAAEILANLETARISLSRAHRLLLEHYPEVLRMDLARDASIEMQERSGDEFNARSDEPRHVGSADDLVLLDALVATCAAAAQCGLPFQKTGTGGIYADRADLPSELAGLPRQRLEDLVQAALDAGLLVKAAAKPGGPVVWLDTPSGPFAMGRAPMTPLGLRPVAFVRAMFARPPEPA